MLLLGAGDLQAAARPADLDHCPAGHLIGELQAGAVMRQQSAGDKDAEAHVLILAAAARPGASRIIGLAETAENSDVEPRSEEHTSELQSLMRISYAVFC